MMRYIAFGWLAFLVLLYGLFWIWYGGSGRPLTPEEGEAMLAEIAALHATAGTETEDNGFPDNMRRMIVKDDGKEFYAINLENLKAGEAAAAADQAYGATVIPLLLKRGSFPVFVGSREGLMLGQYGDQVDRVAIVRYRSLRDLLDMNLDPKMIDGVPQKMASLDHTEVFIARPIFTALHVKLTVGLLLLVLGYGGWRLLSRGRRRL